MNAGRIETSTRLQETLRALEDRRWHSAWDIASQTRSVAVHSDISGLRANGIGIENRSRPGSGSRAARVSEYRLET